MPKIRRWFNVSHDINSDPEVWELTDKFGVAGLRLWLELLSIGDRNEGFLPPLSHPLHRQLSIKCNTTVTRVSHVCDWCLTKTWLVCDPVPRIRNYLTYRPTREAKKEMRASPPNSPHTPNTTNNHKNDSKSLALPQLDPKAIEVSQLLSDLIYENFPERTAPTEAQLTKWAEEAERIHRIDDHPWDQIVDLLRWSQGDEFWKANILSMRKFRDKWTTLLAHSQRAPQSKGDQMGAKMRAAMAWVPPEERRKQ